MTPRRFSLAGLLRLRQIEQDQAASDLANANALLYESSVHERQLRTALAATESEATGTETLYAVAASRAASRGMLAEACALAAARRLAAGEAQHGYNAARARAITLEKLEDQHAEALSMQELREEQHVIDEIASQRWGARGGEEKRGGPRG